MQNISEAWQLISNAEFVELGFVDDKGMPNIRKVFIQREYRSLDRHFISTNTSSYHVSQLANNSSACLYYNDEKAFQGLCLYGRVILHYEREYRQYFWHEGDEIYYPRGVEDDDYCILEFRAEYGEYYGNMGKQQLTAEEICGNSLGIAAFPYN